MVGLAVERRRMEHEQRVAQLAGEKRDIGFGNQIRSYVMQPYQMVKDHRTNMEKGNIQAVLDGDIDEFINSYLRHLCGA